MSKLYLFDGTEINFPDLSHDASLIETKNLLSLGLDRVSKLELMQDAYTLPILKLYGNIEPMTKENAVNLKAEYTDGVRSFKCIAKTKWQGQTSLLHSKKNWNMSFIDDNGNKVMLSFKDWYPTNKFHIKANMDDYSMSRNSVGVHLARDLYPNLYPNNARGVIDSFPIVVYLNDEWYGCYTWNLSQNADLLAMDEDNPNHMAFRVDNNGWDVANFEDRVRKKTSADQLAKLTELVNWTKTCTVEEFAANMSDRFDLECLRYYWLFVDIAGAGDSLCNNTTLATWDGTKWYTLFYDLDIIFGYTPNKYPANIDLIAMTKTDTYAYKYNPIWDKLCQVDMEALSEHYAKMRQEVFTDSATIIKYFTDFRDQWGTTNINNEKTKWRTDATRESYNIDNCGTWITQRLAYCDSKYGYTAT